MSRPQAIESFYLKSARVLLRQYRDGDFALLLDLNSDPEVMKYLTNGIPDSREEVEAGIARTLVYQKKFDGVLGVWIAEEIESGEFMGWFLLRPDKADLDNTKVLELGYRLKKKFWGKGYATEMSKTLIRKAFENLGAEKVFAQTWKENLASRRVMEKVGLRFDSEFIDHVNRDGEVTALYSILRTEWRE
jgi:RimJ/RimL family protein N-acetyltransferase